jgi:replicative DNA helicase
MGIYPLKIKLGDLSTIQEANLKAAAVQLKKYPFYFEDSVNRLADINLNIRAMVLSKAVKLVVVDYLQLIENPVKEPRHLQIGGISRALKRLAMDLNISIIALTQLNKDPEERGGRIHLADVRESESISHDADQVLFLHRPSLYGEHETDYLELAKNRHGGGIAKIPVQWDGQSNTYREE